MEYKIICPDEVCTGCSACLNICPVDCILMKENDLGETHPKIDMSSCLFCNKCVDVCPNNVSLKFRQPRLVYANWLENSDKRKTCASGGIGTILSETVILSGGVVYGTKYDDDMMPICSRADKMGELEAFKGSKYVQSDVGETYLQVKRDLRNGLQVLYIGVPCQIAGLNTYLTKEYDRLITCDLICHGVSPATYLLQELNHLKKIHRLKTITNCRFRGNDGNNFRFSLWNKDEELYNKSAYAQYYFSAYLKAITMRDCCYQCQYARPERISDITIGDFIGLGQEIPFPHNPENVSVTMLNTEKGISFWKSVEEKNKNIVSVERTLEEAVKGGPSLREPFSWHEYTPAFRRLYLKVGWVKAVRKVLRMDVFVSKSMFHNLLHKYTCRVPAQLIRKVLGKNKKRA